MKVPAIIGIILLVVGAGVGVFLVQTNTGFLPRAAPEFAPKELTVTNITENSFTISWTTEQKALGYLKYGENAKSLSETVNDDRDQLTNSKGSFVTHHITVRGLSPETAYFFKVASGGEGQFYDNNGQPYQVTTASVLGTPPPADTAYGEVMTSAQTPAVGALVYVNLPDGARLSTLVRDGGDWALSLSTARTKTLQKYLTYDPENTIYDLLIKAGSDQQSRVVATTKNDQPVPTIVMGQDYDFSTQLEEIEPGSESEASMQDNSATSSASARTESGFNLEPLGDVVEATEELTILNPAVDDEGINTTLPEFHGTAPAGTILTIEVHSDQEITDTVQVGENNTWVWSPPENLEPGEHTVTASYTDANGILQTITRSFTVYAADQSDEPSFVSTPSATPRPTPTPTPTSSPTPTPITTPPPRVSQPSTQSGVPQSGSVSQTFGLLLFGFILIISGGLFYKREVI